MTKRDTSLNHPVTLSIRERLRAALLRPATLAAPLILAWAYFLRKAYLPHGTGKVWPKIAPLFHLPWPPVWKPWWLDFSGVVFLALAALCVGGWLIERVRVELGDAERLLIATSTGFMALILAASALSLARLFRVLPLRVLVLVFLLLAIARAGAEARRLMRLAQLGWDALKRHPVNFWYVALVTLFLSFGLILAAAPETSFDALNVHLYYPRLFLEKGYFYLADLYRTTAPLYAQVLYTLGLVLDGPHFAKGLNFLFLPGMVLVVFLLVRTLMPEGERAVSAGLLGAVLVVSCPVILFHAGICYPDLATAFFSSLAMYAMIRFLQTSARPWLWFAGLSAGFAGGTKYGGLYVAAIVACVVLVGLFYRQNFRAALRAVLIFGVIAAAVGGPWYLRNWYYTGDPFHPVLYNYVKSHVLSSEEEGLLVRDAMNSDRIPPTARNLFLLPWLLTTHGDQVGGALGPVFLWSLPLILLSWCWTSAWLALLSSMVAFALCWLIGPQWLRYFLPGIPMISALAAYGIYHARNPAAVRGLWASIAVAFALVNLPGLNQTWVSGGNSAIAKLPYEVTLGRQSEAEYMRSTVIGYDAAQYLNGLNLPAGTRILPVGGNFLPFLSRYPVIDILENQQIVCDSLQAVSPRCYSLGSNTLRENMDRHQVGLISIRRETGRLRDRWLFSLEHPLLRTDFKWLAYVGGCFLYQRQRGGPVPGRRYVNADLLYRFATRSNVRGSDPFEILMGDPQPTGGDVQPALIILPRNELSYRIRFGISPQLSFALGMDPKAAAIAGGTELSVYVRPEGGEARLAFSKRFLPEETKKGWLPVTVDLASYSNQECYLTLRTTPLKEGVHDWLAIADPVVYATETSEPIWTTGSFLFHPASEKHPVQVRFTPEKVRSGMDEYTIEVRGFENKTVDLLFSVRDGLPEVAENFCRMDANGRAKIFVPAGIPPGLIRVVGVRASGREFWLAARGTIEVIR